MVKQINDKDIDYVLNDFMHFLQLKIEEKGMDSFNSISEVSGKLLEEFNEAIEEAHNKDTIKFINELKDVMVVALWGILSYEVGAF